MLTSLSLCCCRWSSFLIGHTGRSQSSYGGVCVEIRRRLVQPKPGAHPNGNANERESERPQKHVKSNLHSHSPLPTLNSLTPIHRDHSRLSEYWYMQCVQTGKIIPSVITSASPQPNEGSLVYRKSPSIPISSSSSSSFDSSPSCSRDDDGTSPLPRTAATTTSSHSSSSRSHRSKPQAYGDSCLPPSTNSTYQPSSLFGFDERQFQRTYFKHHHVPLDYETLESALLAGCGGGSSKGLVSSKKGSTNVNNVTNVIVRGGSTHYVSQLKITEGRDVGIVVFPTNEMATIKVLHGARKTAASSTSTADGNDNQATSVVGQGQGSSSTTQAASTSTQDNYAASSNNNSNNNNNNDNDLAVDNSPLVVVTDSSSLSLTGMNLIHYSEGSDIWSGNCAVFVSSSATLSLSNCSIQSSSGRGLVIVKRAKLLATQCTIHDCAATGVYVGDSGTKASIEDCNIVRNGVGGTAVPPGHSGVYVESSHALIQDW
jgi:hypothetical protein